MSSDLWPTGVEMMDSADVLASCNFKQTAYAAGVTAGTIPQGTITGGAQVVLEGPASLDLHSAWSALFHHGALKAKVPPEAIGFRIENPAVQIVDLGTEFSMLAEKNGAAEVFVIEGSVEASGRDALNQPSKTMEERSTSNTSEFSERCFRGWKAC